MKILIDKEFDIWMDIAYASDAQIFVTVSKVSKRIDVEGWLTIIDEDKRRSMPFKEDFFVVKPHKARDQPSFYSLSTISHYFISFGGFYSAIELKPLRATRIILKECIKDRLTPSSADTQTSSMNECETILINCTTAQCEFRNSN